MLDFVDIVCKSNGKKLEVRPAFKIKRSKDLMIRGGDFYAVWCEDKGIWSTDEDDLIDMIDAAIHEYMDAHPELEGEKPKISYMNDASSHVIDDWHKFCQKQCRDNYKMLDEKLVFANDPVCKEDYSSKRLTYPLTPGSHDNWDKIMDTLYEEEERHKIEWCIGAIVTGDSKNLQKFLVFYGSAGSGKSTVINIFEKLFEGYCSVFDAKSLGSPNAQFALEPFKKNPLVAIQHDGDLSKIEDNTRLNSLVSHELMTVNEKFKSTYENRFKAFLVMGTNQPVKITDGRSGLIRRLIDVQPTGVTLNQREYNRCTKQVLFELGAIACHCRDVYLEDPNYYDHYTPKTMMGASNDFYNFIIDNYHIFKRDDSITLKVAWEMYKNYCDEANVPYPFSKRKFKEELRAYFREFDEAISDDDHVIRDYYSGFKTEIFDKEFGKVKKKKIKEEPEHNGLILDSTESQFDIDCADCFAQYATAKETPSKKWENVTTKLSGLDTTKVHYVKVPENHIVIDFDIKGKDGKKSKEKNLEAASKWPATYAEFSKSGEGVHLHYIYDGDPSKLSRVYDDSIEIKVFTGNSSLRRKLTYCNNLPIATISSGLPLKGDEKVVNFESLKNEKALRTLIKKNLNKEYHSSTACSIDFIYKALEDAYNGGMKYDVTDMQNAVLAFAANSTHQADKCIKLVNKMKFKSDEPSENVDIPENPIAFYDIEVFPNLFLVNWKREGEKQPVVRMINPTAEQIAELCSNYRLIGFNCRRYDNHVMYARILGKSVEELYDLSQKLINAEKGAKNVGIAEAYNLSYTDIYDFAAKRQSLKKWEIELGIHHQELGLPWDEPVPESMWPVVAEYCDNDVIATEAVWNHLQPDFLARQILADIAGMSVNDTTNSLTTRIIFGREKHPKLVYTDLSETFPGYEYKDGKNMYRGTDLGFGGYVYSEPGMYTNVALLDVASLHPHSIKAMNCFGDYTKNFTDIMDARIFIKHGEYDKARELFGGKLAKYLEDPSTAKQLSQALKIAINSVYGLTSANFDNPFRDIRNKNNIVALRGALFMRTLQDEVVARGFKVAHIKTDSIKIPDATPEIINFCMEFARKYGYEFEHEATYEKMCLVNNAVYIAKYKDGDHSGQWTATGTQFAVPYVFKTLFSKEPIEFEDMCETKSVKTCMYLDLNESLPEGEHDYKFVGKVGQFCPIKPGHNGGILVRSAKDKDGNTKYDSVTGTKDHRWAESERVRAYGSIDDIDRSYHNKLVDDAIAAISEYGDFEWFASDDPVDDVKPCIPDVSCLIDLPWKMPCGRDSCIDCPNLVTKDLPLAVSCGEGHDNSYLLSPQDDDGREFSVR